MGTARRGGPQNSIRPMVGFQFGRFTVIAEAGRAKNRKACWLCRCECGVEKVVVGCDLRRGNTLSCGCLRRDTAAARATHGKTETPEHNVWCGMKARCQNANDPSYHRYGGRGITVDDRWRDSFEAFLEDMGPRPSPLMTLERIDNNGPYAPENCRWATRMEQAANTRKCRPLTHDGMTKTLHEWSRHLGIHVATIHSRLKRGWSVAASLNQDTRIAVRKSHDG